MHQWFYLSVLSAMATGVAALEPATYTVALQSKTGAQTQIATLNVTQDSYAVDLTQEAFSDHFLSMRPFKCVDGPETLWCHVPYPYEIRRTLGDDLVDLEYDFLFVWKKAGSYGINLWNGVYYVLEAEGTGVVGRMYEIDMDVLSVPPDAGELRPISEYDLTEADPDSHWWPVLRISLQ